jgi:hypothetical protein
MKYRKLRHISIKLFICMGLLFATGVYGELVVKPLREADKALSSESANARISTWSAICARPRYFNRRVAAERAVYCPTLGNWLTAGRSEREGRRSVESL